MKHPEKDIYEAPVIMEISPVSFVAGQGTSGPDETGGNYDGGLPGNDNDEGGM